MVVTKRGAACVGASAAAGRQHRPRGAAAAGWRHTVHAGTSPIEQQRPSRSGAPRSVHSAADRRWQRYEDDLAALASHVQDAVTVLLTQVLDVCTDRLDDPQTKHTEQAHPREVEGVCSTV